MNEKTELELEFDVKIRMALRMALELQILEDDIGVLVDRSQLTGAQIVSVVHERIAAFFDKNMDDLTDDEIDNANEVFTLVIDGVIKGRKL